MPSGRHGLYLFIYNEICTKYTYDTKKLTRLTNKKGPKEDKLPRDRDIH